MQIDIITLFPEMFTALNHSIVGKAQKNNIASIRTHQLRNFAINEYGQVDDAPYGGEAGMVLRPEPIHDAITSLEPSANTPIIFLTPQGKVFKQADAKELGKENRLVFLCGHYKGIDERIRQHYVTHEYSIGDYVLTGGEIPAMVLIDSIVRLLPGAMGNRESAENDSHYQGTLSWPLYTRPENFKGHLVPEILLSGHHANIKKWQHDQALLRTKERRPDLLQNS